jgi:hypothetical protein
MCALLLGCDRVPGSGGEVASRLIIGDEVSAPCSEVNAAKDRRLSEFEALVASPRTLHPTNAKPLRALGKSRRGCIGDATRLSSRRNWDRFDLAI